MLILKTVTVYLIVLNSIGKAKSARILCVYPFPSYSHQQVFRVLTNALAETHELVVITSLPTEDKHINVTEVDVSEIQPILKKSIVNHPLKRGIKLTADLISLERQMTLFHIIEATFENDKVKTLLKEDLKFDLVISPPSFVFPIALAKLYNAPMIWFSSSYGMPHNYEMFGAPARHPFIFEHSFRDRRYNLSLWEKIYELYIELRLWYVYGVEIQAELEYVKKYFGEAAPSAEEMYEAVDLMFVNVNPIFEGNRPVPPNVVHLGGLHLKPAQELSQEWKSYLDGSERGVIYASLGTNVRPSLMEPELFEEMLKAFESLPYDILWKFDGDALPRNISNVRIEKWLPQRDMLFHPKIKAFITQGGLQSTDEAIDAGVPLVGLPMLADQSYNCERYVQLGIGVKLEVLTMTAEDLVDGVKTVVQNKSYKESISRLGALMRDQPQSPLQRAVWWTEHALRHRGAAHLRCPAANVAWADYLMLDVVLVLTLALSISLIVLILLVKYIVRAAVSVRKESKSKLL